MPAPKRQTQPLTGIAQTTTTPVLAKKVIEEIAANLKNLPAANFTLINYRSPNSLPQSCAQILFQEKLLDQQGQVIPTNLGRLRKEDFVTSLRLKLIYALVKSSWQKHLFQIADILRQQQPEKYHRHLLAFSRLFAEHYSYYPASAFFESGYIHLISPRLALKRLPYQKSLEEAKSILNKKLGQDKNELADSAYHFLKATDKNVAQIKGQTLTDELASAVKASEVILPLFDLKIDHASFPQISVSYSFPEG